MIEQLESRALFASGALDPTFGVKGVVAEAFPFSAIEGMRRQPDGKIAVAGDLYVGKKPGIYLARYSTSGQLDSSFGSGGGVYMATRSFEIRGANPLAVEP